MKFGVNLGYSIVDFSIGTSLVRVYAWNLDQRGIEGFSREIIGFCSSSSFQMGSVSVPHRNLSYESRLSLQRVGGLLLPTEICLWLPSLFSSSGNTVIPFNL